MVDWRIGPEPTPAQQAVLRQPFEPARLTLVARGEDALGSWELYDGPHPRAEDPDTVGHRFVLTRKDGGRSDDGGVGPRLRAGELARVGSSTSGIGRRGVAHLQLQCQAAVAAARVCFDDGTRRAFGAVESRSTGERWVVCSLDAPALATSVEFLDETGAVLDAQSLVDPRTRLREVLRQNRNS